MQCKTYCKVFFSILLLSTVSEAEKVFVDVQYISYSAGGCVTDKALTSSQIQNVVPLALAVRIRQLSSAGFNAASILLLPLKLILMTFSAARKWALSITS